MIANCYVIDIYCDNPECPADHGGPKRKGDHPREFTGRNSRETFADAHNVGWRWNRNKTIALCPTCVKNHVPIPKESA